MVDAVVAQSIADQLWTDPSTGQKYARMPFKLGLLEKGAVVRNPEAGSEIRVFEYQVPDDVELQFIPMFGPHFLSTDLKAPPSYAVSVEVWDAFFREFRGTIWDGTTTELCRSMAMRQNGYPLVYNGAHEVRALPGDIVVLQMRVPHGCPVPLLIEKEASGDPTRVPLVEFFARCYKLEPVKVVLARQKAEVTVKP